MVHAPRRGATDNDAAGGRMFLQELCHAALNGFASALDLYGRKVFASSKHEIDLFDALSPPEDLEALLGSPRNEPGADSGLNEMPAKVMLQSVRFPALASNSSHKGGVKDHEAWRTLSSGQLLFAVLLQTANHAGLFKKLEVMSKRDRIAGILQLPQHLGIRELLCRVGCAEPEKRAHKRWFANILEGEYVLRDGGLDDGITNIGYPSRLIVRKISCVYDYTARERCHHSAKTDTFAC